jgi:drug/metabolite transporter (DMT)-like permease
VRLRHGLDDATRAKLLLVLCGICWGFMWPMIKIGISGLTPWSFRVIGFTVGAATLLIVVKLTGRRLTLPDRRTAMQLFISSLLNVVAFGVFSTFAMLTASTGRVAVVSYSFPVWACLLAWLILGERLRGAAALGLALCVAGLVVLVYPVIGTVGLIGLGLSLASAMTWAVGTIYLKLVKIPGDLIVNTAWQMVIAAGVLTVCTLVFQGWPTFEPAPPLALMAVVINGLVGSALCYFPDSA